MIKFTIRIPNWLLRIFAPKLVADLEQRSTLTGTAAKSFGNGRASAVFKSEMRE